MHLQQYHLQEIYRGLVGDGEYRLKHGFPPCCALPPPPTAFSLDPHMIVQSLQNPSAEVKHILSKLTVYECVFCFIFRCSVILSNNIGELQLVEIK